MFNKRERNCGFGGTLTDTFLGVKKLICFDSLVSTHYLSLYKLPWWCWQYICSMDKKTKKSMSASVAKAIVVTGIPNT